MNATAEIEQLDFALPPIAREASDPAWLESLLWNHGGWLLAADICEQLWQPADENNKRWIRKLASGSRNIISGQAGYRHRAKATEAEISHCRNALRSQARELLRRYLALGKAAHAAIG